MRAVILIAGFLLAAATATGGTPPDTLSARHFASGAAGSVLLTNHGFGLGGLMRVYAGGHTTFVLEASIGAGKDEREQEFFTGPFGETVTPYKRNYFMMLPVTLGLEQRLWPDVIENNFRPFIQIGAGPVVGYQWPYFEDHNGNGVREQGEPRRGPFDFAGGEFRLGASALVAFGAYFGGERGGSPVGLRIGYTTQYFIEPVDLLELRPEIRNPSRHFFGTPVVTLHLFGF